MTTPTAHPLARCPVALWRARDARALAARPHDDGRFVRVRPGVYADASAWSTLRPSERYLARVYAYALVSPGAVFAFESAAALLGLPMFGEPRDIHIYDATRTSSRRFGDVCVHTSADVRTLQAGSLTVTGPLDTAVDLMRVLPPAYALAIGDAAVRAYPQEVSPARLFERGEATVTRRGIARLRWSARRVDAAAESVGESVSRAVIEWCGYPEPQLQRWFHYEGVSDRSDFYWPKHRAIGESDGYDKYGHSPEEIARELRKEKLREDRLRRHEDGFARWDLAGAMSVAPLRRAVQSAGVVAVRPPQSAFLETLRSNPRSLARQTSSALRNHA